MQLEEICEKVIALAQSHPFIKKLLIVNMVQFHERNQQNNHPWKEGL